MSSSSSIRVGHRVAPLLIMLPLAILLQAQATNTIPATYSNRTSVPPVMCLADQASALLRLMRSFSTTGGDSITTFWTWIAGTDCCRWEGVRCGDGDGRVTSLDLGGRNLQLQTDGLDPALFRLTSLKHLDLAGNNFIESQLPAAGFERLTELTHLDLSDSNFAGRVPAGIGRLTSLVYLDLSTSFEVVEFDNENIAMYFESSSPSQLSDPNLETLLANLTNLEVLRLGTVNMSGNGARWCDALAKSTPKIQVLSLPYCSLGGPICGSLSALQSLTVIELHYNHLSGQVLEFLAGFSNLSVLQLSNNKLQGWFPPTIFQHRKLTTIDLTKNLGISGILPNFSDNSSLQNLSVSRTNFSGTIPSSISNLKSLKKLGLGASGFSGMLPSSIGYFDLSFNYLEGPVPIPQDGSGILDYSTNRFSSMPLNFSAYIGKTILFKASRNNLSGNILPSICHARSLQLIDLSENNLSGSIPSCLMEDVSALQVLSLKNNKLVGKLPDNIKEGCAFVALDFSGNLIEGKIPRSLVACRNLEILDIGSNQISDSFPCWMSKLPELEVLVLKSNKFSGQVLDPSSTGDGNNCEFTKLRIADMASNNFSGTLPEGWFKMLKSMMVRSGNEPLVMEYQYYHGQTYRFTAALTYKGSDITIPKILRALVLIDVSKNAFHGSIPEAIGELVLLHGLNMSHNALTGSIPTQFSNLNQLESLDLSSNELSGEIPKELASLNFLSTLNLSYNMLAGRIPESSQFSTFSNGSFLGNNGLCGPPLSKQCSDPTEPNMISYTTEKNSVDVLLFLFTGLGFGVSFAITIIVIWGSHNRKQS